jgi:hypothetical protein
MFTPFPQDWDVTLNSVLKDDIPYDEPSAGFVYVFAWPSKPGFLKIGYTGKSVQDRFDYWKDHHPGLEFVCSISVPYPKRIETLIHLELRESRHEIIICRYCHNLHNEWFQVSKDLAFETLTSWKSITTREALYTKNGQLGGWWAAELRNNSNEYNSAYLTSLLDESDRLAEAKRQAELARQLEEDRVAEQARLAEERRVAEEIRQDQEARHARMVEQVRQLEQARAAEEAPLAEEARLAEERRIAEQARQLWGVDAHLAEQLAEQAWQRGEVRVAVQRDIASEARVVDMERQADELEQTVQAIGIVQIQQARSATQPAGQAAEEAGHNSASVTVAGDDAVSPASFDASEKAREATPGKSAPEVVEWQSAKSTAEAVLRFEAISPPISAMRDSSEKTAVVLIDQLEALDLGISSSNSSAEVDEVKSPKMTKRFMLAVKNISTKKMIKSRRSERLKPAEKEGKQGTVYSSEPSGAGTATTSTQLATEVIRPAESIVAHLPTPPTSPPHHSTISAADQYGAHAPGAQQEGPWDHSVLAEVSSLRGSNDDSDAILQAFCDFFEMLDLAPQASLDRSPAAASAAVMTTTTTGIAPASSTFTFAATPSAVLFCGRPS